MLKAMQRPASASSTVSASTSDLLLDGPGAPLHSSAGGWGGPGSLHRRVAGAQDR